MPESEPQGAQALWPVVAANEPGLHGVAAVARAKQRLPMGQSIQAVSPLDDWNLPAAHAAQMLWPVLAVMVPGSHSMAAIAPVAHADPAGHCVQSLCAVAPVVFRKDPALHSNAALAPSAQ